MSLNLIFIYTGVACRSKVCKLGKQYFSPEQTFEHHQTDDDEESDNSVEDNSVPISEPKDGQEFIETTSNWFRKLDTNEQLQIVTTLFQIVAAKESDITINGDFIQNRIKAMSWLKKK